MKRKIICMIFLFLIISSKSYATTNTDIDFNGSLEDGVGSLGVWISPSCEYTYSIPQAIDNWNYPGWSNPVNMVSVEESQYSYIDFYQVYRPGANYTAYTICYSAQNEGLTYYQKEYMDWRYAEITLNEAVMGSRPTYKNIGTIIHEMGHAMGLKDINRRSSIMHFNSDKIYYRVTRDANDAIVRKY